MTAINRRKKKGLDVSVLVPAKDEAENLPEPVEEDRVGPLRDAHRAVALHVAVTANGARPRTGLSDTSTQQEKVDDLLDVRDRIAVLGQPHRPANNDPFRA